MQGLAHHAVRNAYPEDAYTPAAIRSHSTAWHDAPPEHIQAVRAGYMATEPVVYADEET